MWLQTSKHWQQLTWAESRQRVPQGARGWGLWEVEREGGGGGVWSFLRLWFYGSLSITELLQSNFAGEEQQTSCVSLKNERSSTGHEQTTVWHCVHQVVSNCIKKVQNKLQDSSHPAAITQMDGQLPNSTEWRLKDNTAENITALSLVVVTVVPSGTIFLLILRDLILFSDVYHF